jgi:hypothetical protein
VSSGSLRLRLVAVVACLFGGIIVAALAVPVLFAPSAWAHAGSPAQVEAAALVNPTVGVPAAEKDVWDKMSAAGPLIGGVLVGLIGAFATVGYNARQQSAADRQAAQQLVVNRVQTLSEFMPQLASADPRQVEAALVCIAQLGDPKLATSMAVIYKGEGGAAALERLSAAPDAKIAEEARATLESALAIVRESVATIYSDGAWRANAVFLDSHTLAIPTTFILKKGETSAPPLSARVGDAKGSVSIRMLGLERGAVSLLTSEVPGKPLPLGSSAGLVIGESLTVVRAVGRREWSNTDSGEAGVEMVRASLDGLGPDGFLNIGDIQVETGFAGAAVLDRSGALIGMIFSTNDRSSRAGGRAIPIEKILSSVGTAPPEVE